MIYQDLSNIQKIYSISGTKNDSYLKTLNIKTIYEINQISISRIPAQISNIFLLKKNFEDEFDTFIILSFVNKTLIYEIDLNT